MPKLQRKTRIFAASLPLLLAASAAFADTLVLRGAHVLTMDDAHPEANAIAVVDGRIAAVGSDADMQPFLKGAEVYDLPASALVLPGFQDSHNHLVWSATELQDTDLTGVADADALKAALDAGAANLPAGAWLRAVQWDVTAFPRQVLLISTPSSETGRSTSPRRTIIRPG